MTANGAALAAAVILLFPMGYFFLASPAFLLVKLDIRPVALLLRGMFNAHFLVMRVAGIIAAVALVLDGRLLAALGVAAIAAAAPDDDTPEGTAPAPVAAGVLLAVLAWVAAFVLCLIG